MTHEEEAKRLEERRQEIEDRKIYWKEKLGITHNPQDFPLSKRPIAPGLSIRDAFLTLKWEKWDNTKATVSPAVFTQQGADAIALNQLFVAYAATRAVPSLLRSYHSNQLNGDNNPTYVGLDKELHADAIKELVAMGLTFEGFEEFGGRKRGGKARTR